MKRGIVLITVVGALGLLVVGTVSASPSKVRTRHVPTTISHDSDVLLSSGQSVISGHLGAPLICKFFRQVRVKAHYPDGRTRLLDTDLTSIAGAWAVKADISGADRLKATATRQVTHVVTGRQTGYGRLRHGKGHHRRIVCEAASVVWGLD